MMKLKSYDNFSLIKELKSLVNEKIDFELNPSDEEINEIIESVVLEKSKQIYISIADRFEMTKLIFNSMRRLDLLQPLIDDDEVTEIMVNGVDSIFIEKKGRVIKLQKQFESVEKLEDVIQHIVSKVNRVVNESNPIVDARLKDGSRVNVVLKPIALNGPILTIRKFPKTPLTIEDLIQLNTLNEEAAQLLKKLVVAKYNIFVCGGTSSGKTTFLNALSNFIPKDERIITIEDSAELQINTIDNLVRLETRNANIEGKREIKIRDLIRSSLRMRPDRIIVGEVRGGEALDMLQAMNTGHAGSLSTGHANSTKDMISRLETMVLTGVNFPIEAVRQQIASAIDIFIHLGRLKDKSRKVLEICEVVGYTNGKFVLNQLFGYKDNRFYKTNNNIINDQKLYFFS